MAKSKGVFILSLDLEFYWGVHDVKSLARYKKTASLNRQAVVAILMLFREYSLHTTWAIVGAIFLSTKRQLTESMPKHLPNYVDRKFSPYAKIDCIGETEAIDPSHFAESIVKQIIATPHQEIATHTFSHYYCLEAGQTAQSFRADLVAALNVAKQNGIDIKTVIFPRNQVNEAYFEICKELGIKNYRGNQPVVIYQYKPGDPKAFLYMILRVLDSYIRVTGTNSYDLKDIGVEPLHNVRGSHFLRPYGSTIPGFGIFERVRLRRIIRSMTEAACEGKVFHLWVHPDAMGPSQQKNMSFMRQILEHYLYLKKTYGMQNLTIDEAAVEASSD